jgi:hypothetical protein
VTLSTVEWFSPDGCHRPYLHKLNTFDKKTQKWTSKLKNYDKFLNYHNCELVMALPIPYIDGVLYHMSGYAVVNLNEREFNIFGISPVIFEVGAKPYNYRPAYQPVLMKPFWMNEMLEEAAPIIINKSIKDPNVYFEMSSSVKMNERLQVSKTVTNLNIYVFVTPGDKYTPYEKFILPFDMQTWILLFVTFSITFLTILIINRLPKKAQNIVYGENVATPILNVIQIFFGISQTTLPTKKFSRFILMFFVFFCLIFRTCFQSKFFEFMTSDPTYPPPKTIAELRERNYRMSTMKATHFLFKPGSVLSEWYVSIPTW